MIRCTITSPSKTDVYETVHSVVLPAISGKLQVLPGHVESFISLKKGNILLRQSEEQAIVVPIMSGECHIQGDMMAVIL